MRLIDADAIIGGAYYISQENCFIGYTQQDIDRTPTIDINKAISKMEEASKKDKLCGGYPYNRCIDILKEVLNDG